ncbi:envelope-like protein [Cucumis melo var. makuwa]|uniref:Envelope-like protein n=1 Tax=Cucumis melo var. makuwa TaxID=1194695 RepID=A0A5D3DMN3_CUCMM|nr:envelope-like protein [Cucumis melo var. makuwa]TYK24871.1 envelope-like protein [Cucumis melo var. makuwa]
MCISLIKLYMALSKLLELEFEMSMVGELSCFLGLQIKQKSEGIFISQEKHAKNIVKKFGRPDIAYVIGICARYQADPRISHLEAVKRILKYVHGTSDFGILYFYDTTSILIGYYDADWTGSSDDKKSTSEGCFFLENYLILWFSTHASNVPETFLSDIDSDDLDDVLLAQLLKKTTVPEVPVVMPTAPFMSIHSQESSSIEGVFVPTFGVHHTFNVQPGPSIPFESNVAHASVPGDVSAAPEVRTDVRSDKNELDPPNPDIHSKEVPVDADNNPNVPPASPEIPPNIPSVPIDGISFHHEENVQRWKFVVEWRLANEEMLFDLDCSPSSPSTEVLASVLSGGTLSSWLVNGIPAVALSVKYAILHKIDIAN